ncbi:MAG: ABC transporter ATP-binding protein [Tissierellia bacterium]|nr:ABC transporter ATP-binding protein [Tissierellia bacterium]
MIKICDVNYKYKGAEDYSLKNINCEIDKGECILVTGNSGCGKSTLTRIINGLIPHEFEGEFSGRVNLDESDISLMEMWEIASRVGSVFQNPRNQFFSLDTTGEIVFGMENLSFSVEEMRHSFHETVKTLRIEELLDRNIFEISGGEKQLIAIGSIYALKPEIFIMDEPSANLDKKNILKLRNIIKILKSQGKTVIIAEHRIYYLHDLIDRMIYMKDGKIDREYTRRELSEIEKEEFEILGIRSIHPVEIKLTEFENSKNSPIALEVRNLVLPYGKKTRPINFSIRENEIMGIIGSIGCGKTTLSRILTGLLREKSGQIYFYGNTLSLKERCDKAYMIMQDPDYQLFMDTAYNELKYSDLNSGKESIKTDEIERILGNLNLLDYKDRHPMALSGGQKQRLSIAVSMMMNSKIVIFDEPTSGLDYKNMLRVSKIIKELSERGKLILIISHDYEFINNTCNRVYSFN